MYYSSTIPAIQHTQESIPAVKVLLKSLQPVGLRLKLQQLGLTLSLMRSYENWRKPSQAHQFPSQSFTEESSGL